LWQKCSFSEKFLEEHLADQKYLYTKQKFHQDILAANSSHLSHPPANPFPPEMQLEVFAGLDLLEIFNK